MAETENNSSTIIWLNLFLAFARIQARCPGEALPGLMLKAGIEAGQIRCRAWFYQGRIAGDPSIDEPAFWRAVPGYERPIFNYERSYVRRFSGGWNGKGYVAYQVEVVEADIDALLTAWRLPQPLPVLAADASDTAADSGAVLAAASAPAPGDAPTDAPANEPAPPPQPPVKSISDTERRVYKAMEADPPHHGERGYAKKIHERLGLRDTDLHTVENYVSRHRRKLEIPKKSSKGSQLLPKSPKLPKPH